MKHLISLFGLKLCGIVLILIPLNALSQQETVDTVSAPESQDTISEVSRHSLYGGVGVGSNMIYLGSTISGNLPFAYSVLMYSFNNELSVSVSTFHLSGFDPYLCFNGGSLSYSHVFNSWFDISAGLSGYNVAPSLADTLFNNFMYGDLTIGIDWRLLYSRISAGGLISDESSAYFQLKNSRYIKAHDIFHKKGSISFDPYINLLFGTLVKIEETAVSEGGNSFMMTTSSGTGLQGSQNVTSLSTSGSFNILEASFGIPVTFNFNKFALEAEASYVLPTFNDSEIPRPKGFVFLISGSFKIF